MMKIFLSLVVLVLIDTLGLRTQHSIDPARDPIQAVMLTDIRDRSPRQSTGTAQNAATLADAQDQSVHWSTAHAQDLAILVDIHDRHTPQVADPPQDETTLVNPGDPHMVQSAGLAQEVAALINRVRTEPSFFLRDIEN